MKLTSLRSKVLLAYVVGVALSMALIVLFTLGVVTTQAGPLSGTAVAKRTEELVGKLQFDPDGRPAGFDTSDAELGWVFESLQQEMAYRVLDGSGAVVLSSASPEDFWPADSKSRRLERGRFEFERGGVAMRGATEPVVHEGHTWYLQFAASERFLHLSVLSFALPLMGTGITFFSLVLLIVFGACAYVTLQYTLRPLRAVSDSAAAISPRSLQGRLPTAAIPTEIAPLVESFNEVLERLERGYRLQQEFLATAAHELKTPLALIRAQIEFMPEGDHRDSLLNDVGHMARQVQQLLLLAEASEGQSYRFSTVDVLEVVAETARYLQRMAEAAGVVLVTPDGAAPVCWQADRGALFTLLKNLLENALEHAPRGSEVRVEVSPDLISVRDRGPGVSQEQLFLMFSRFWRGAHRRDHGAGLGLTICQEIAFAHGWTLSAQRAEPGLRLFLLCSTREGEAGEPASPRAGFTACR